MNFALDALVFATGWTHVLLAPYSKVEESFNLHATHDVLMYGVGIDNLYNYDHFTFPGAVPRTFVGSVLLAWISTPFIHLASKSGLTPTKFELQIILRLVLASLNALCLCFVRRATSRRFGRVTGLFFALLTCSQFHLPFWMGRTIPNTFALIPVNYALYLLIDFPTLTLIGHKNARIAISLLTFTAIVFRAEIALLLAPLCLQLLFIHQISFVSLLKTGIMAGLASIACTVLVDSYFWDQPFLWPELSSIWFNIVEGKSSEWGTSPAHTYLTAYLPKLLLGSLPLSLVGLATDHCTRSLLIAPVAFIGLISCLGHKEWRFIAYVVPLFNIAAGRGARWLVSRKKNTLYGRLASLLALSLVASNLFFTIPSTLASIANYPGGEAMVKFHQRYSTNTQPPIHVHISNLAAQSGASLFLHLNAPPYFTQTPPPLPLLTTHPDNIAQNQQNQWTYNKTENLFLSSLASNPSFLSPITHLISETPPEDLGIGDGWRVVDTITSFERFIIDWELLKGNKRQSFLSQARDVVKLEKKDRLWILERRGGYQI